MNINLTDEQIKFLKQFAANQHEGAKDNLATRKPMHLVQTETLIYKHDGGGDGDYDVYFNTDDYESGPFKNEKEIVLKYGEYGKPEDIIDYETAFMQDKVNGKTIWNLKDYFEAYGICSPIECCSVERRYKTVARFFILENAREYIKQQKHNLVNPRTYTVDCGYSNNGEYEAFFDLLMSIGTQLNNQS